jgi:hypothetical protein
MLLQILNNLHHCLLNTDLRTLDMYLRPLRLLIRCTHAGKLLDFPSSCFLIQTFGIPLLRDLDGDIDINLDKRQALAIIGMRTGLAMQFAGEVPVRLVGADEARDGDGGAVGEELGDLGDATDVFRAVGGREAQVLVQPEAYVVPVEEVGVEALLQEVLLQRRRNRGLARGGQTRQPDCQTALVPQRGALKTGKTRMPCYVSNRMSGPGERVYSGVMEGLACTLL